MHAWDCRCGTRNAPALPTCRACGRPMRQGRPVPGPQHAPPAGTILRKLAFGLMGIGGLATLYFAAIFDVSTAAGPTSVWGRVVNLNLMAERQNGILVGLALAGAGFLAFLVDYVIERNR